MWPLLNCFTDMLTLCAWRSPDTSRVRSKMIYASSKDRFKRELDGIQVELQATDPTEMGLDVIRSRANWNVCIISTLKWNFILCGSHKCNVYINFVSWNLLWHWVISVESYGVCVCSPFGVPNFITICLLHTFPFMLDCINIAEIMYYRCTKLPYYLHLNNCKLFMALGRLVIKLGGLVYNVIFCIICYFLNNKKSGKIFGTLSIKFLDFTSRVKRLINVL